MSIISILLTFIVIGAVLWLFNKYTPMSYKVKTVCNVLVVGFWILYGFGVLGRGGEVHLSTGN